MKAVLTPSSYVAGSAVLVGMFGPLALAAIRWRQRLFPDWRGLRARVVELVLTSSAAVTIAEILGSLGAFKRWPMLAASAVTGVVAAIAARPSSIDRPEAVHALDVETVAAVLIGGFVVARWMAPTIAAIRLGPLDTDTQIYHLPHAARFFQDGWLSRLLYDTVDDAIPYHPQNGEIFHAYGMLAYGRDIVSPLINIGWLLASLGAAWTIGKRFGSGLVPVAGTAAVLASPLMISSQGGAGMTDIVAIFFVLAAVALLMNAKTRRPALVLAGLAAGMAIGTKLTIIVVVAILTVVGMVVAPKLDFTRALFATQWFPPLVVTGGFWYARNLARVHNPLPALGLHLGPLNLDHVPMYLVDRYGYTVADYALDTTVWRKFFVPGLARGFGPAWFIPVVAPLVILALVAIVRRRTVTQGIGLAGIVGFIGYTFTPTTALGLPHRPTLFVGNLRYAVPYLVIGFAVASDLIRSRRGRWTMIALCLIPLAAGLARDWSGHAATALLVGAAGTGLVLVLYKFRRVSWRSIAVGVAGVVAVTAVGYGVQRDYLSARYRTAYSGAFKWAQDVHNARIGMAGFFLNYPLYGADLSNRVIYIGDLRRDGTFTDYRRCSDWRAAVNRGRFDYVVTMPPFPDRSETPMAQWTSLDPHVTEILHHERERVFKVQGQLDPAACKNQ